MKIDAPAPPARDVTTDREVRQINVAGAFGTVYTRLALGEVLLLYITKCLGIPKEQWAIVASIIPLTTVFNIVSAYIIEHIGRRKFISLGIFVVARMWVPTITLLPFFFGPGDRNLRLLYIAGALLAHSSLSSFASNVWMSWVADIVPQNERGKFYSSRFLLSTSCDVACFILAGVLLDVIAHASALEYADPLGYALIFGIAFAAGEIDILIHWRVKDRPMSAPAERISIWTLLAAPWRHIGFRKLMFFRLFVAIADGVVGPFAIMYLFDEVGVSASTYAAMAALFLIANALSYPVWRRIGERLGYRTVATISYTLSGVGLLFWWFIPHAKPHIYILMLIFGYVSQGIVGAGFNLSMATLTLNVAPKKHFSMYYAQIMTLLSMMVGAATLAGCWVFVHTDPAQPVEFFGTKMTGVHVLLGLLALIRVLGGTVLSYIIPDARAEATHARFTGMLRINPIRFLPLVFAFDRPLSADERDRQFDSMLELVQEDDDATLGHALRTVLADVVNEDEFYGILGRERVRRTEGVRRMCDEIADYGALHVAPARAKAAEKRIRKLYKHGDFYGCLRTVRRLASQTSVDSERARSARRVIAALANDAAPPREEAALLGIYAFLQIVREPRKPENDSHEN